jgi:photosystem II stability/assembly factor-like uncharacterized protein
MRKLILLFCLISLFACTKKAQEITEYDNPSARQEWIKKWNADRQSEYKSNESPANILLKTIDELERKRVYKTAISTRLNWEQIPCDMISGRIRSILQYDVSPNVMWCGAVAGGLYRSTDYGATWYKCNAYCFPIACLAKDNKSPIFYAGTGEGFGNADGIQGVGILRSNDGRNFGQLTFTKNWKYVHRIATHPTESGIAYATGYGSSGYQGSVWKSINGGVTWTEIFKTPNGEIGLDIKICPKNGNKILLACYRQAYVSQDGGATWVCITDGKAGHIVSASRCEIAWANDENICYISQDRSISTYKSGYLYKSSDGGLTWTLQNNTTGYLAQGWFANAITVSPLNANVIAVGGLNIHYSTDGGVTLQKISDWTYNGMTGYYQPHADVHCLMFDRSNNKRLYVATDGGIFSTEDVNTRTITCNGIKVCKWDDRNKGLNITQFYKIAVSDDGNVIVGGTQDNGTVIYRDGSIIRWLGGDGGYCAVRDNNNIYGSYQYLSIMKGIYTGSAEYPYNYKGCTNGITGQAQFLSPFVMNTNKRNVLYAGNEYLWKTTDGAITWTSCKSALGNSKLINDIAVTPQSEDVVWVTYMNGGGVWNTYDGGTTWNKILNFTANSYTSVAINPNDLNTVIVSKSGYTDDHLYLSKDGGITWKNTGNTGTNKVPAVNINVVSIDSKGRLYAGTDAGLFFSDDAVNWYSDNKLPLCYTYDIKYSQDKIYVATHGLGIFRANY